MSSRRREWLSAGAVGLGTLLIAYPRLVFFGERLFARDAFRLQHPLASFVRAELLEGRLPLWFPHEGLGVSLSGSAVAGLFHPGTLLHLAFDPAHSLTVDALFSTLVAGLAVWWLARRLDLGPPAAATAAVLYALGGPFQSVLENATFHRGAAALPIFLLGVLRVRRGGDVVGGSMLAAAGLAVVVLSGDLQTAHLAGAMAAVWVWGHECSRAPRSWAWPLLPLVGIGLGALCLAAVVTFPAWSAFLASDRGAGLPFSEAAHWSLHPLRLPALFVGDLFPGGADGVEQGAATAALLGAPDRWSASVALGGLALLGSVAALLRRRTRTDWLLLGLGLGLTLLALGEHGGLYRVWHAVVPLGSAFRFPEKLVLHASLPLALLAGRGLDRLELRSRAEWVLGLGVTGAFAGCAAVALTTAMGAEPAWSDYLGRLGRGAAVSAALVGVSLAALRVGGGARWVLPLLALLQLRWLGGQELDAAATDPAVFAIPSPVASFLVESDPPSPGSYRLTSEFTVAGLAPDPTGALRPRERHAAWQRMVLLADHNALFGIESTARYLPALPPEHLGVFAAHAREWYRSLLPVFNDRYLVTAPDALARIRPEGEVVAAFDGLGTVLFRYRNALPRAYLAEPVFAADAKAAARRMLEPDVLAGRAAVLLGEGSAASVETGPAGAVRLEVIQPSHLVLDVRAEQPALLVVSDSHADGWEVRVDGETATLERANVLVRGVRVEAGEHRVEMRYRAPGVRPGIGLSAVSWLGLGALLGMRARRRRQLARRS